MASTYEMGLQSLYMQKIKDRKKVIEMRVNDDKRKRIRPGDHILFHATEDPNKTLEVEVVSVKGFPTFKELYDFYPKYVLGYGKNEEASYLDMYSIYTHERIEENGVLAIGVRVLE